MSSEPPIIAFADYKTPLKPAVLQSLLQNIISAAFGVQRPFSLVEYEVEPGNPPHFRDAVSKQKILPTERAPLVLLPFYVGSLRDLNTTYTKNAAVNRVFTFLFQECLTLFIAPRSTAFTLSDIQFTPVFAQYRPPVYRLIKYEGEQNEFFDRTGIESLRGVLFDIYPSPKRRTTLSQILFGVSVAILISLLIALGVLTFLR
jgi:hypothetical protein